MRKLPLKVFIVSIIQLTFSTISFSQSLVADTGTSPAVKNAVSYYNSLFSEQLHLYNGKEYKDYVQTFTEGQPYFEGTSFIVGTVDYDGSRYQDVSILYNTVTDNVIILSDNKISKINLIKEKVKGFSILGHTFVNLASDSTISTEMSPGFYDVLASGTLTLLAKRRKTMQANTRQTVEWRVYSKDHYYLKKNNVYHSISNKNDLLDEVADRRKDVQQYIKQNKLKFGKDPESVMIKVVEYYNQLNKK